MAQERDTEKVTTRWFRGDKEKLSALFPGIGYNKASRHIIHNFIKGVEEKAQKRSDSAPTTGTIDIGNIIKEAEQDE